MINYNEIVLLNEKAPKQMRKLAVQVLSFELKTRTSIPAFKVTQFIGL